MANERAVSNGGGPAPCGQCVPGADNGPSGPAPFVLLQTGRDCEECRHAGTCLHSSAALQHNQPHLNWSRVRKPGFLREHCEHYPCDLCHLIQQLEWERGILLDWLYEKAECEGAADDTTATAGRVNGWQSRTSPDPPESSSEPFVGGDSWPAPVAAADVPVPFALPPCQRVEQIDAELCQLRQLQHLLERSQPSMKSMGSSASSSVSAHSTATMRSRKPDERNGHAAPTAAHPEGSVSTLQRETFMELLSKLPSTLDLLLTLTTAPENCLALTQFSAVPVFVQLIHDPQQAFGSVQREVRDKAMRVLNQLVVSRHDDKRTRREIYVLRLLERLRKYADQCRYAPHTLPKEEDQLPDAVPLHPLEVLYTQTRDADYRHTFAYLGGLQAVAEVLIANFDRFDNTTSRFHGAVRQFGCMILTNLTCGDGINKAVLCTCRQFLDCLAHLLAAPVEELRGYTAAVVRNLGWKADVHSQEKLREAKVIPALLRALLRCEADNVLCPVLSALNNLAAHSDENKNDMCAMEGVVARLIALLKHKPTADTHDVTEHAGGLLYRLAKLMAHREDYRQILRDNHCYDILVEQLRGSHLGWVGNAVKIIGVLSVRSLLDQKYLWDAGAGPLLHTLSTSKYPNIAEGSARAYRNLLNARCGGQSEGRKMGQHASVPSSPLTGGRYERGQPANRSLRDVNRLRRPDLPNSRTTLLMASISRQVSEGTSGEGAFQRSPPLSPGETGDPVRSHHSSGSSLMRPQPLSERFFPKDTEEDYEFPPGNQDEFVDFSRKGRRNKVVLVEEFNATETIKRFDTERTPQFSAVASVSDLRVIKRTVASTPMSGQQTAMASTRGSRGSSPDSVPEVSTPAPLRLDDVTEVNSEYSCMTSRAISPSDLPESPSFLSRSARKRRLLPVPPVERPAGEEPREAGAAEEKAVTYDDEVGLSKATSLSSIVSSCIAASQPALPPQPPDPGRMVPSTSATLSYIHAISESKRLPTPPEALPAAETSAQPDSSSEKVAEAESDMAQNAEAERKQQFDVHAEFGALMKMVKERKTVPDEPKAKTAESSPVGNGDGSPVAVGEKVNGFDVASQFALLMRSVHEKKGKIEEEVVVETNKDERLLGDEETMEKVDVDAEIVGISSKSGEEYSDHGNHVLGPGVAEVDEIDEKSLESPLMLQEKGATFDKPKLDAISETAECSKRGTPEPAPETVPSTSVGEEDMDETKLMADLIYMALPMRKPVLPVKTSDKKKPKKPPNPRMTKAPSSRHRKLEDQIGRHFNEKPCPPAELSFNRSRSAGDRAGLHLALNGRVDEGTSPLGSEEEPDVGDLLDGKKECKVESRFTSEASEGEEEKETKRPRIVKPVRCGGSVDGGGRVKEKPGKGGCAGKAKKSSGIAMHPVGMLKPPMSIRGGGLVVSHPAEAGQNVDTVEEGVMPSRIVKQGTFTKDRPSGMVPVILPEVAGSPNRKRFGSAVRGPQHRDIPVSPRKSTTTTSPSPRPSRYGQPKSHSFPGHDVILNAPPPPDLSSSSFPPPTITTAQPPKKTIRSKIAFWKKKTPVEKVEEVPSGIKSPALSERGPGGSGGKSWGVWQGISATLPKMREGGVSTFKPSFPPLGASADGRASGNGKVNGNMEGKRSGSVNGKDGKLVFPGNGDDGKFTVTTV